MTTPHPMTLSTLRFRLLSAAVGTTVLLTSACVGDQVVNPLFGAGCDGGTLRRGTTLGALNEDSCVLSYHPYTGDRSAYVSYGATLDAGKAYMLTLNTRPDPARAGRDGLDPVLFVTGRNDAGVSALRAASDDDAGDLDSELFFIAPRTSHYRVIASSYLDPVDYEVLGGFALTFRECPVLALRPDTGTTAFDLRDSECRRSDVPVSTPHVTGFNFLRVKAAPYEEITISTTATDFTPVWHAFGPGMDTFDILDRGFWDNVEGSAARTFTFGRDGGYLTIAVTGRSATGPSRRVQLRLMRRAGTAEP